MRDQSHSAERTATALGDGDPIATHATGHHTENGHTHQVSDPSNGITVSIQDAPARYGSVPNWSWITGMVIGATTHQRTSRPCVGTVTPSRARSQAIIVGTVCGQLIGNPRDALPRPLFLPFQLEVIEWQLGHISLRFDGILLPASPSM